VKKGIFDHVMRSLPRGLSDFSKNGRRRPISRGRMGTPWRFLNRPWKISLRRGCRFALGSAKYDELKKSIVPPYDATKFPNKWRKMAANEPARTLMAHLGKDSYSHIHYDSRQAPDNLQFEKRLGFSLFLTDSTLLRNHEPGVQADRKCSAAPSCISHRRSCAPRAGEIDGEEKLSIKRLTRSDLTFFRWQHEHQDAGNQKAINLNRDVFVSELFPALPAEGAAEGWKISD